MAALSSITDAAGRINAHLAALKALAASVTPVPAIPPVPLERAPLNPVPPIRASLIGEPMQNAKPIMPPARTDAMSTLSLKGWEAPGGVEVKPDNA